MITVNKSIDINTESYPKCQYNKELCDPNILFNDYAINKKDKCLTCEHWKSNYDYIENNHIEEVKKDPN